MSVLSWLRRKRTPTEPPPASRPMLIALSTDAQQRTRQWLIGESDDVQTLGRETLHALTAASPYPWDAPAGAENTSVWVGAAFKRLETCTVTSEPATPELSWRYLALVQVLCTELAAAYTDALRQGRWLRCPLTDTDDRTERPRPRLRLHERQSLDASGLGLWLAGARLPNAGQVMLGLALEQGWEGFAQPVRVVETEPFQERLNVEKPVAVKSAKPPPHPRKTTPAPRPRKTTQPPHSANVTANHHEPASITAPPQLHQAVTEELTALLQRQSFNRHGGDGWFFENAFWASAKSFAERLQQHPWVSQQAQLQNRKTLYRVLAQGGLILPDGSMPIWKLCITDSRQPQPQYASVLKLPASLAARCPDPALNATTNIKIVAAFG